MAGVRFRTDATVFLYSTASRSALRPSQPPIQWVPGTLSLGIERLGREGDHSPSFSVEVNNGGAISSITHMSSRCGAQFIKYRDNFTFTFYIYKHQCYATRIWDREFDFNCGHECLRTLLTFLCCVVLCW
jgi:hypothetical protein